MNSSIRVSARRLATPIGRRLTAAAPVINSTHSDNNGHFCALVHLQHTPSTDGKAAASHILHTMVSRYSSSRGGGNRRRSGGNGPFPSSADTKSSSSSSSSSNSGSREYHDSKSTGGRGAGSGGSDGKGGDNGKGMFVDQNERMQKIFDKLKERLPAEMKEHFEPGSVNYHISKTLMLLMDDQYLKLLPRAIEEFDRAIELAQQQRQFAFLDTVGQSFLRDQLTMHGGRRGYELVLSLLMGLVHERKEPRDALRIYNSILDMEGVIAETYYCRGVCHMRGLADYSKAKEDLEMAIRIRGDFYQAYDQLGVLIGTLSMVYDNPQAVKRNRESALRLFDQAIEINSHYAPAYTNRAALLMHHSPERALQDLERSLQMDNLNAYTYQQMGTLFADHMQDFDMALQNYNMALQLQPHNPTLYQFRSLLYRKMGRAEDADRDLQKAQDVHKELLRDMTVVKHY